MATLLQLMYAWVGLRPERASGPSGPTQWTLSLLKIKY